MRKSQHIPLTTNLYTGMLVHPACLKVANTLPTDWSKWIFYHLYIEPITECHMCNITDLLAKQINISWSWWFEPIGNGVRKPLVLRGVSLKHISYKITIRMPLVYFRILRYPLNVSLFIVIHSKLFIYHFKSYNSNCIIQCRISKWWLWYEKIPGFLLGNVESFFQYNYRTPIIR